MRVAVKNAGVNFADVLTVQGKYQIREKPPFTPGIAVHGPYFTEDGSLFITVIYALILKNCS